MRTMVSHTWSARYAKAPDYARICINYLVVFGYLPKRGHGKS